MIDKGALLVVGVAALWGCGGGRSEPSTVEIPAAAAQPPLPAPEATGQVAKRPAEAPPKPASVPHEAPAPSTLAMAEALFREGKQLMTQGAFAAACAKFEESSRLDPAVGTMLNLAVCEEQGGHVRRACERFREAARMALANGQRDREQFILDRIAKLGCAP